jgi:putative peptidoglycan lipid II flippase
VAVTELPELSRLADDDARLRRLAAAWRQIAFLSMPSAVGFLVFGWLLVGVAFGGGLFGADDQLLVTLVLASFTLGLLPATSSRLLQNLFYSVHETRYPGRIAVIRVVVSVALGGALMFLLDRVPLADVVPPAVAAVHRDLRLGAAGLGLGATAGAWLELALLARGARRRMGELGLPWRAVGRMQALAWAAALPAGAVWWLVAAQNRYVVAAVVVAVYAASYLGAATALRFPEMKSWLGRLR